MIPEIQVSTYIIFIAATSIAYFYWGNAVKNSISNKAGKIAFIAMGIWLALQMILAISEFYLNSMTKPPTFLVAVIPPVITIIIFSLPKFKQSILSLPLKTLTLIHIIRLPVEITLHNLYLAGYVPEQMTYSGTNFDIIAGLTAPIVAWYAFKKEEPNKKILIYWNVICLILLINIVSTGVLSAPTIIQQLNFDEPNKALFYFPFIWLPSFVVPAVLFSHIVSLRQLFTK